ncbi:hypothetical protein DFJ63DRAFT_315779 [Scheffersomyces coipomensis]|uniref:uncharacterized protein n=1 Tax=Scheffersomyces coipomensis TaxID=1788519 RepID=UPI00315D75B4
MEKQNPLLPFAFTSSSFNDHNIALNTTPRERAIIDENAKSIYHTRVTSPTTNKIKSPRKTVVLRPNLKMAPSLKRRMGESFNEKDDIKRRDVPMISSDQPTEVDDDDGEEDEEDNQRDVEISNVESEPHSYLPPSSPPVEPPMSEFEFTSNTISNYNVPESPPNKLHHRDRVQLLPSEIELDDDHLHQDSFFKPSQIKKSQSYSPQKRGNTNTNLSSDADFGIDKFHRFKTSINFPSSSTDFDDPNEIDSIRQQSYAKARSIILDAFEEIKTIINLEKLNLYEIPDEIKDLNKIVVFDNETSDSRKYQLFLTNNNLYDLTPALFKFTKLNVLGLRQNKLRYLPPLIAKLNNLTDLSLGTNKLTYLPFQILQLNNLQIFQAGPNPFMKIPPDAIKINNNNNDTQDDTRSIRQLNYISKLNYFSTTKTKTVPSLKTICLDKIANYDVSYQETKDWKKFTPKLYHNLIIKAIKNGKYQDFCCQCSNIVVDPVAEIYEWWDYLQNKNIPIRKQFCSGGCIKQYDHYNSLT